LSGHAIIGTPLAMLSTAEFQPQCGKNPPPDGWFKISVCRARIETTTPIFRADLGGRRWLHWNYRVYLFGSVILVVF
jgi:hypothetical protein